MAHKRRSGYLVVVASPPLSTSSVFSKAVKHQHYHTILPQSNACSKGLIVYHVVPFPNFTFASTFWGFISRRQVLRQVQENPPILRHSSVQEIPAFGYFLKVSTTGNWNSIPLYCTCRIKGTVSTYKKTTSISCTVPIRY